MWLNVPEKSVSEGESVGERRRERIYKWPPASSVSTEVAFGGGGGVGVNSLTISELECRTFYGLSALRLMCEEITLFPTPLNMTT